MLVAQWRSVKFGFDLSKGVIEENAVRMPLSEIVLVVILQCSALYIFVCHAGVESVKTSYIMSVCAWENSQRKRKVRKKDK